MNEIELFCLALTTTLIIMVIYSEYKIDKLNNKLNDKITGFELRDSMIDGKLERLEDSVYALMDKNKKIEDVIKKFPAGVYKRGTFKKGDRVRFKTRGGWYNSGIITDVDDDSCLIEVDTIGCEQSMDYGCILLPYYVRILLSSSMLEREVSI